MEGTDTNVELDILDFLPKYPNIHTIREDDNVLDPYPDGSIHKDIYNKKEFYDLRLDQFEQIRDIDRGELLKHQQIIARFFSSRTLYDQLLLFHEMGTGKTRAAIGALEQIRNENNGFNGSIILTKGTTLHNNFKEELRIKYRPENYYILSENRKSSIDRAIDKEQKLFYSYTTFQTFKNSIRIYFDSEDKIRPHMQEQFNDLFSNKVIVIDEIHNIREKNEKVVKKKSIDTVEQSQIRSGVESNNSKKETYNVMYNFLHTIKGCKVLLMSGTPMKDKHDEISDIMNLILPQKLQLPPSKIFLKDYFDKVDNLDEELIQYTVKSNMKSRLINAFKGRVSYLKAMPSEIIPTFMGGIVKPLNTFKVVTDIMSDFQTSVYNKSIESMGNINKSAFYSEARQASLFVFPDGSYGNYQNDIKTDEGIVVTRINKGFTKYVKESPVKTEMIDGVKKIIYAYKLSDELKNKLKGRSHDESLVKLRVFSSKYEATIRQILESLNDGKSNFVYCDLVDGSGLILFSLILDEIFGFSKAKGNETTMGDRYAILTSATTNRTDIDRIVKRFNQDDNMHGQYINVIIGSNIVSEGLTFKNVQCETILSPHWNYSETSQVIARGVRLGSHKALLKEYNELGGELPSVQIFQRVAVPATTTGTILDLYMYRTSEIKDRNIKGVERILKESSFDCALTYNRNYINGVNGQRECDYQLCEYNCNQVAMPITDAELDYSTYQLYYTDQEINVLIDEIINMFHTQFTSTFKNIQDNVSYNNEFMLLTALSNLINEDRVIINKYGFVSYLREKNNVYFLSDSLSVNGGDISSVYYTREPNISDTTLFSDILNDLGSDISSNIVKKACVSTSQEEFSLYVSKLPVKVQGIIIESFLTAQYSNIDINENLKTYVITHYSAFYNNINGVLVSSWFHSKELGPLRCMTISDSDVIGWQNCSETDTMAWTDYKKSILATLDNNYGGRGCYGTYKKTYDNNVMGENFCLNIDKKRVQCVSWKTPELLDVIINVLKIPDPYPDINLTEIGQLRTKISSIKPHKNIIKMSDNKNDLNDVDYLKRYLYWNTNRKTPELCSAIYSFMKNENLLIEDVMCGDKKALSHVTAHNKEIDKEEKRKLKKKKSDEKRQKEESSVKSIKRKTLNE